VALRGRMQGASWSRMYAYTSARSGEEVECIKPKFSAFLWGDQPIEAAF
jgi:hypothetical protein